MKNTLCGALLFSVASLAGCAGVTPRNVQTPAQIAAQVCPPIQATLGALQALPALPGQAQADLALAIPIVDAACGVGALADVPSLQALERTALPILSNVVKAAALSPAEQDRILAAQIVLSAAVAIADPVPSSAPPAAQPSGAAVAR
ncbi:MAG TPA: hypothetical protein VF472_07480 [Burkholderiaceae bacterium]